MRSARADDLRAVGTEGPEPQDKAARDIASRAVPSRPSPPGLAPSYEGLIGLVATGLSIFAAELRAHAAAGTMQPSRRCAEASTALGTR